MQRISQIRQSLSPPSSPAAAHLRTLLLTTQHKLIKALRPALVPITRIVFNQNYTRILISVEAARSEMKGSDRHSHSSNSSSLQRNSKNHFEKALLRHMQSLLPLLLNQIADRMGEKIIKASESNLLGSAIKLHTAVKGSYIQRFSLRQSLTPNALTLRSLGKRIQNILETSSDEQHTSGYFFILVYIGVWVVVHTFSKYIAQSQEQAILHIMQEAFVMNVIEIATSLSIPQNQDNTQTLVNSWIQQLAGLCL